MCRHYQFCKANIYPRRELKESRKLRETDNIEGQILFNIQAYSTCILKSNGALCLLLLVLAGAYSKSCDMLRLFACTCYMYFMACAFSQYNAYSDKLILGHYSSIMPVWVNYGLMKTKLKAQ